VSVANSTMPRIRPDISKAFRYRLKAMMLDRDWSPYDLSKASGVSAQHIYRICRGDQSPSLDMVKTLLRVFGKTMIIVDESEVRSK